MYRYICYLIGTLICFWLIQGEYMPILHGEHIYEVMPTRKIWKINFQWNCSGWGYDRECEEGEVPGKKLMRLYRKDTRTGKLHETTTVRWDAHKDAQKMWINSTYRQNNDYIEQWITVPLDMWDYTYTDENARRTNMSIQFTGSHLLIWYNDYTIVYVWLRDQAEDITYTTHIKFETGFYFGEFDPAQETQVDGQMYWYYGDESLWCWINCSQQHVYNFSGYYDEVLSPRTDAYQIYQNREDDHFEHSSFCTYYNCTRAYENYPSCIMLNYTVFNITAGQDEVLLDLGCINQTYNLTAEKERAVRHWSQEIYNITNIRFNGDWNQMVPDDPFGKGIIDGVYTCLQRDYCHDFRPFQLFNYGSTAARVTASVVLILSVVMGVVLYHGL